MLSNKQYGSSLLSNTKAFANGVVFNTIIAYCVTVMTAVTASDYISSHHCWNNRLQYTWFKKVNCFYDLIKTIMFELLCISCKFDY